jgi:hypothetical protein
VLRPVPVCLHAVATTPADLLGPSLVPPQQQRPSPKFSGVGFRITLFEACSAFTRVTACLLAESPVATLYTRGFVEFVASPDAPIATGWSDSCRAGLTPAGDVHLFTAH